MTSILTGTRSSEHLSPKYGLPYLFFLTIGEEGPRLNISTQRSDPLRVSRLRPRHNVSKTSVPFRLGFPMLGVLTPTPLTKVNLVSHLLR